MSQLFCFGLGYSARLIAAALEERGWRITGTSTTAAGVTAFENAGFDACLFDGTGPAAQIASTLSEATHVLLSIPPGAHGDPAFIHHGADIGASPSIRWIGYFSTVGVYGDAGGAWVDEETVPNPVSDRGRRRLAAERQWLELGSTNGKCVMVFRLPGIYGPGRCAIDDIENGTARRIVKPGQVFNRIHVDDIASAIVAAIEKPRSGRIYNVTDDTPGPPQDVIAYAAELLDVAAPPEIAFEAAELTLMARSFYGENKRVSNARLKAELGVKLRYPCYRDGLAALLHQRR